MAPANILIVEDEIIIAEDLQTRLKRLGYSVAAVAFSGVKAVDQTVATCPDLVLMDIMLKGDTDGIEVARQIRAKLDVPVIYVTAYADNAKLQRAIHTEPYGYIIKPFRERELYVAIEMALYKHKRERELKERLEKLQLMADSLPSMISYIDAEQRYRFTNKAFEEWSGHSAEELNGQQIKEVIGEQTYLEIQPYIEDTLKGKRTTYESLMPGKDGAMRCISAAYIPSLNKQGEVAGFFAVVNDITGQKQAEEDLQRLRDESSSDMQGRTAELIKAGQQMEAEIAAQKQTEGELRKLYEESERRVQEITAELAKATGQLNDEIAGRRQAEDELQRRRGESGAGIEGQAEELARVNLQLEAEIAERKRMESEMQKLRGGSLPDVQERIAELLKANQQLEAKIAEHRRAEDKLHILFEEIKNEADMSKSLLQIVEALNARPDTGEIVRNVLALVPKYLKLDRGCIFMYEQDSKDFVFTGGYGLSQREINILSAKTFTLNDFPSPEKILQCTPVLVENVRETGVMDREIVRIFNIANAVIVPIAYEGKITGLFYGDFRSGSPIEPGEVSFLKKLADWLGVAVYNSRLYKESVEKQINLTAELETIKTMSQIVRDVLSTLDRTKILATVSLLINRIIPCERSAVLLKEKGVYRVVSEWGIGRFQDNIYDAASICGDIELKHTPVFIADISQSDERCLYHREQNLMGIKSSFVIPLLSKGEIIGMLDIGFAHMGVTSAYFTKAESIASQIAVALEHAKFYEDLENLMVSMTVSLASALDAKSAWSKGHSERVAKYAAEIARELGLSEDDIENLRLYGLLHDIGQIGMHDILLSKQGKLTEEEYEHVKKHPQNGAEILESIKQLSGIIPGIRHHHERYDGRGYPSGLSGEDIPLYARILRVADSFDSMTADRPYRSSFSKEFTVSELQRLSGAEFDPKVVGAFLKVLDRE